MGFYENQFLPRLIDVVLRGGEIDQLRERAASGLQGTVLEVGFGSGRNIPYYPTAVSKLLAVDPATVGRKLAARRVEASPVPVEYIGLDGQKLPVDDESIDHVLVTWTLCTIPAVDVALGEIRRVLRPGGALHFVEHGRSPDHGVARWQDRLTPLQRRVAGGCHLNRPIDQLVAASGLQITKLDNLYVKGPKPYSYMFVGTATN